MTISGLIIPDYTSPGHCRQNLHEHLTINKSSATAERSFSSLLRLKTYLRATVSQQRLNSVMVLHIHQSHTDNLDIGAVVKDFISLNDNRRSLFGSCNL